MIDSWQFMTHNSSIIFIGENMLIIVKDNIPFSLKSLSIYVFILFLVKIWIRKKELYIQ